MADQLVDQSVENSVDHLDLLSVGCWADLMVVQKVDLTAPHLVAMKAEQMADKLDEHSVQMMVDLTVNCSVPQSVGHWVA